MWSLRSLIVAVMVCAISAAGCFTFGYSKGRQSGMTEVQSSWNMEKVVAAEANAAEMMKARQRESALRELVARLRKEKADEAKRIAAEYAADLERLRNRPSERAGATGVPEGATAGVGCTGAGLAALDATLLAGYARDAARLQSAYGECKAKYTEIERKLNGE